jgi:hypothetical protein
MSEDIGSIRANKSLRMADRCLRQPQIREHYISNAANARKKAILAKIK